MKNVTSLTLKLRIIIKVLTFLGKEISNEAKTPVLSSKLLWMVTVIYEIKAYLSLGSFNKPKTAY